MKCTLLPRNLIMKSETSLYKISMLFLQHTIVGLLVLTELSANSAQIQQGIMKLPEIGLVNTIITNYVKSIKAIYIKAVAILHIFAF